MNLFLKRYLPHYKALFRLGVPIVVGQIGTVVLNFADTLMIGRYGLMELAAASFVNPMFILLVVFSLGFSLGLTPIVGGMFGRGDKEGIGLTLRNGLAANGVVALVLLAVSLLFYFNIHRFGQPAELLPYMRSYLLANIVSLPFVCLFNAFKQFYDGITDTRTPMYVILGGNIANIFGNWVLIFGHFGLPALGLLGAGLSTMVSRIMMLAAFVLIFMTRRRYRPYLDAFLRGTSGGASFRRISGMGLPVALQLGMEASAFSLSAVLVGWIGVTALAAHQVMSTVSQVFYMVYSGMAAAVAVRVSYFHGQGDLPSVRASAASGFHVIMLIALMLSSPVMLLRESIGTLFTDSAEVCSLVARIVVPVVVYQFGDGLQYVYGNSLRGISCVRPMIWIAFFSYIVVSLPLSWLLGIRLGWGLPGVWWAYPVCLFTAGLLYRRRFFKEIGR